MTDSTFIAFVHEFINLDISNGTWVGSFDQLCCFYQPRDKTFLLSIYIYVLYKC